jgi:Cysteine-rich secretory protein family
MLNKMRSRRTPAILMGVTLSCLLLCLLPALSLAQEQFDAAGEKQLAELINQERAAEGLPPLAVDERLTRAARRHTELMVKHGGLSHQFDGEPSLQTRIADENLRSDRLAENVGLEMDAPGIHAGFMNSPPHRANILNPNYNAIGVGVMRSGDRLYATEDFAHRLPDYSEPEADAVLQKAITNYAKSLGIPAPVRKPEGKIHQMACDMALIDTLDTGSPRSIAGVHRVLAWTATELQQLPEGVKTVVSQPLNGGYSLGICFAPSVSHPGGAYWIVMVTY